MEIWRSVCVNLRCILNFFGFFCFFKVYVYPLIIEQKQHLAYFESDERHFLQLFKSAEFLRQKQVLADYTFGKQYLYAMNPDSFDNLIYAELEFHACKGDRLYDFSSVVLKYAKCFESECYLLIKRLISVLSQRDESVLSLTFTQMGKSFVRCEVCSQTKQCSVLTTTSSTACSKRTLRSI